MPISRAVAVALLCASVLLEMTLVYIERGQKVSKVINKLTQLW